MKEEIYIRLHPNNINRDSRIEIPEAWFPLIKKHSSRSQIRTTADQSEATAHTNNEVRNVLISASKNRPESEPSLESYKLTSRQRPARQGLLVLQFLMNTGSTQLKRRDLHH